MDDTCADTEVTATFSKSTGEALRTAGALSTVGLAFVLALVIGFWFGSVLDGWFGTKPVLSIVFFFFGLAAGILNVYRIVSQAYPRRATPAVPPMPQAPHREVPGRGDGPGDRELDDDDDR